MTPLPPFAAQAQSTSRAILAMTRKGLLHLDLVGCWVCWIQQYARSQLGERNRH